MRYHIPSPHCGSMLLLNRYWYTLPITFCKAMSRCSVDGQVSRSFLHEKIGERNVFAAATCTDSIVAKMRRRTAMIVEVVVTVHECLVCKSQ